MGQARPIPEIPKDFWAVLDLLSDPDAYAEKLKALETVRDEAIRAVEAVAPAEEIPRLRIQAQSDRTMAANELTSAKHAAAQSVEDATHDREAARKGLQAAEAQAKALIAAADGHQRSVEMDLKAREVNAESVLEKGQIMQSEAQKVFEEAQAMKAEYEAKMATFKRKQAELAIV